VRLAVILGLVRDDSSTNLEYIDEERNSPERVYDVVRIGTLIKNTTKTSLLLCLDQLRLRIDTSERSAYAKNRLTG
jgi:hypothetical protein